MGRSVTAIRLALRRKKRREQAKKRLARYNVTPVPLQYEQSEIYDRANRIDSPLMHDVVDKATNLEDWESLSNECAVALDVKAGVKEFRYSGWFFPSSEENFEVYDRLDRKKAKT